MFEHLGRKTVPVEVFKGICLFWLFRELKMIFSIIS